MRRKTIALAAVLLVGGIGTALGQTTAPGGTAAPTIAPSGPHTQNPMINPNAAGTRMGPSAGPATGALKKAEERGGSREINPNTHPLTSLKARKQLQKQGQNVPTNTRRLPQQTADSGAGR